MRQLATRGIMLSFFSIALAISLVAGQTTSNLAFADTFSTTSATPTTSPNNPGNFGLSASAHLTPQVSTPTTSPNNPGNFGLSASAHLTPQTRTPTTGPISPGSFTLSVATKPAATRTNSTATSSSATLTGTSISYPVVSTPLLATSSSATLTGTSISYPVVSSSVLSSATAVLNGVVTQTDTTPPPAPTLVSPANGAVISTNTPVFDWSDVNDVSIPVIYELLADNSGSAFPSPEISQGAISTSTFTPNAPLTDGTYSWKVRARDGGLNFGPYSNVFTFTLDTAAPTGSIVINNGDDFTNNPSITLSLACSDGAAGSGCSEVSIALDGVTFGAFDALTSTKLVSLPAGDGLKTVAVKYKDTAGNVSPVFSDNITLDTASPSIDSVIVTPEIVGTSAQITISKQVSDAVGVLTVSADLAGPANYEDIPLTMTSGTEQNGTWEATFSFPADAPDGTYTISDTAVDNAENSFSAPDGTVTLDRTPPSLTLTTVTPQIVGTSAQITITSEVSDSGTGVSSVVAKVTGPATFSGIDLALYSGDVYSGTWIAIFDFPASISEAPDGLYSAVATATDGAGNTAVLGSAELTLDRTAPQLTVPPIIIQEATGPSGAAVTFEASAIDEIDNSVFISCDYSSGSTFQVGDTIVSCSATDDAQNSDSKSFTITVQDTTDPVLIVPSEITVEATSSTGAQVTFEATATDIVDIEVEVSCDPSSGALFGLGTTQVSCSATDDSGNSDEDTFSVIVQDTTKPTLNLPADITSEATGPSGSVGSFSVTAQDTVDGSLSVQCTPSSGSTFPITTTQVNCSATDTHGNSQSGSFSVTVRDTTSPILILPGDITTQATSPSGAIVSFTATANDLVDGTLIVDCTPSSGSIFAIGTTQVSCQALDSHGNPASGSFNIIVQNTLDTTAPVISGLNDITVLASGPSGTTLSYSPTASDDTDGSVPVICSPSSPHLFAITTTTVTCSASDSHGNTASGTFKVKVYVTFGSGFAQPVDNGNVYNTVKAGATVPLKFNIYGGTEITDVSVVNSLKYKAVGCNTSFPVDDIETTATGGTSLRYDTTTHIFVYNWKTPSAAGCYQVTIYINDGTAAGTPTTLVALFKLK